MPERWIIDAMNVIGTRPDGWWKDPDRAVRTFVSRLDAYARTSGKDVTVVLDKDPGELPETSDIEVVVARRRGRNAADHAIEQLVGGDADPGSLLVVTSDRKLADDVTALGATVVSSGRFRRELDD
jgi:predicted RNA-binding protein with PIN domain